MFFPLDGSLYCGSVVMQLPAVENLFDCIVWLNVNLSINSHSLSCFPSLLLLICSQSGFVCVCGAEFQWLPWTPLAHQLLMDSTRLAIHFGRPVRWSLFGPYLSAWIYTHSACSSTKNVKMYPGLCPSGVSCIWVQNLLMICSYWTLIFPYQYTNPFFMTFFTPYDTLPFSRVQ